MNKKITDQDLNFLLGNTLKQICFGLYDIQFNFVSLNENEHKFCNLSIFQEALFKEENGTEQKWNYQNGSQLFNVNKLLNKNVNLIEVENDQTLVIGFSDKSKLIVLVDDLIGESYTISNEEYFFVV